MSPFERLRDPSEKTLGILLLAPAFLLLALIVIYPIGKLIWNSFYDLRLSGACATCSCKACRSSRVFHQR